MWIVCQARIAVAAVNTVQGHVGEAGGRVYRGFLASLGQIDCGSPCASKWLLRIKATGKTTQNLLIEREGLSNDI